jgi:hypothetical protein
LASRLESGKMPPMEDQLRNFWTPLFAYLNLLGVLLVILGIALAGLVSALLERERKAGGSTAGSITSLR